MTKFWSERKTAVHSDIENDSLFTLMQETNSNILITGAAGTGKSTLLKKFVQKTNKNCVVLAPTGIAAANINGQTIHSFFSLPPGIPLEEDINKKRFEPLFENVTCLIIDEISMVREDLFEAMDLILKNYKDPNKPFGGVQIILFGDMYQLPPVVTNNDRIFLTRKYSSSSYYFFNSDVYEDLDLWVVHLNYVYRQSDSKFIKILNHMQKNILTQEDMDILNEKRDTNIDEEDYVILSTRNNAVEKHNQHKLNLLMGPTYSYSANINRYLEYGSIRIENVPAVEILDLKVDARVMFLVNDKGKQYYNGSLGTVISLSDDCVDVKLDSTGDIVHVTKFDWEIIKYGYKHGELEKEIIGTISQIPLKLAWAMTIHKSQGQTLDKVLIDLRYSPWESGHSYVAFSRLRTLDGLKLKTTLRKEDILVDPIIINWERKLKEEKIDEINENKEMTISGINYEESKEIINTINKELINDFEINKTHLVSWQSQSSVLIKKNPFFFNFVKSRLIYLLKGLKEREKKKIIIDEDKKDEIVLVYKPSAANYYKELMKKVNALNNPNSKFEEKIERKL
jgi:ATP-dependent DNA helicase PIF1